MDSSSSTIDVTLTVKDNLLGDGNTGGGRYDYAFDPDLIHVTERNTEIVYRLAEEDQSRFRIVNLYSTDTRDQLGEKEIRKDGAELKIVHRNTYQQLTVVSLLVHDTKHDHPVNCDPQVTNDPAPVCP
jgi:hypothetical protein